MLNIEPTMKAALVFCVLSISIFAVSALDSVEFEICEPNQQCGQLRGVINYDWETMSIFQKKLFRGRSWIIRPDGQLPTTVTLAFKDVHINQTIYIATNKNGEIRWRQIFGNSAVTSFERIETDVDSITLYIPGNEQGSFTIYYYVGCDILTGSTSEIIFPDMDQAIGIKSTCWMIKPDDIQNIGRIYLSLRDVYLIRDARIKIEDLHSNTMIADVDQTMTYDIYGTDTSGQETILVDLTCDGERLGTCDKFGNLFSMSYYALDKSDVYCIETQKHCALDPWFRPPESVCSKSCPTLEHIIEEEIVKEGPALPPQGAIMLKSAAITAAVRHTEEIEEHGNQTVSNSTLNGNSTEGEEIDEEGPTQAEEEEEEELEEEEEAQDKRIKPKKPKAKAIRCQLKGKYCKCLRTQDDARQYCFSKRKCKSFGFCAIGCIWARIIICAKMTSSASIRLLSG